VNTVITQCRKKKETNTKEWEGDPEGDPVQRRRWDVGFGLSADKSYTRWYGSNTGILRAGLLIDRHGGTIADFGDTELSSF